MKVFAHRGDSAHFAENTQSAIQSALEMAIDGVEVDVQSAKDDFVIIHDSSLDRTTNGCGNVRDYTLHELALLDAGNGQKIPSLQQLLNWNSNKSLLNLELKHTFDLKYLALLLESNIAKGIINPENILLSSFNHHQLAWMKNRLPWLKIGALTSCIPLSYAQFAQDLNAYSVHVDKSFVNKAFCDDAKQRGLKIYAYTVDKKIDIERMLSLGIDGIFANDPLNAKSIITALNSNKSLN
ncbi:glycerophosphodiester phosphodiesterase [Pseudoalteromonas sp. MMG010]|uniref:glycerophosphodiester phosphodiesterase n=1 Tax=Pseudoalteromonas sp. MMG010 TaxID=2822685 RepID=UPI001B39DE14|nr:glycerophosphodiester phosphodiesterase family protein [Pseudoalteromonas sp. MMG010]MBQ4832105.1 glycerophosphodiester phosphodiesterase [Pseudoalteromonas sp. MMG010]